MLVSLDLTLMRARRCAFTLTELLVVMGVIGTLAVLTLVGVRKISQDAKLALGTNTVVAALNEARSLAIKEHNDVLVAFFPRLDGPRTQVVEVIIAEWTGDTILNTNTDPNCNRTGTERIDRFLPVSGVPVRRLPKGISVATPFYHRSRIDRDDYWEPLTYLPWVDSTGQGELIGQPAGVLFSADGTRILRNSHSDTSRSWIDFDDNGEMRIEGDSVPADRIFLNCFREFDQIYENDEPFVSLAPFLAVYDFEDALEYKKGDWSVGDDIEQDLVGPSGYITELGNRIHFNRYSGVIMR
jgi:prepilin-type N-terminal cleavage/methylation domain-containing protein